MHRLSKKECKAKKRAIADANKHSIEVDDTHRRTVTLSKGNAAALTLTRERSSESVHVRERQELNVSGGYSSPVKVPVNQDWTLAELREALDLVGGDIV